MTEFYCPACGEVSRWRFAEQLVLTPGAIHLATCEHCGTAWEIRVEFHEKEADDGA